MRAPCGLAIALNVLDWVMLLTLATPLLILVMLLLKQQWKFLLTPDVPLPGDLTVIEDRGFFRTSFRWLMRNRLHGLEFKFAKRLPMAWDQSKFGLQEQGDLWWERKPILGGKYQIKRGWRQYVVDGLPYGVPCCTITKA